MIYPGVFEEKLGFDQIRAKLKQYCLSTAGEAWVDRMAFSVNADFIAILLKQNLEFRQILEKAETFPAQHFYDPSDWFQRIRLEGNWLEADEFLKFAYALETIQSCKQFLDKAREIYPELYRLAEPVAITNNLRQLILAKIDDKAMVKDSASPTLGQVRKKLRDEQNGQFEKALVNPPDPNAWFHARIEVTKDKVSVYVNGDSAPSLTVTRISTVTNGKVGLWAGEGSGGEFANLQITKKIIKT